MLRKIYGFYLRSKGAGIFLTPFHLVTASPWPIVISFAIFGVVVSFVLYLHSFGTIAFFKSSLTILLWAFMRWVADVVYEGFDQGFHTGVVQEGLRLGFVLFIFSEIMFFFAFFWGFFHSSLVPGVEVGASWFPVRSLEGVFVDNFTVVLGSVPGIVALSPWDVPFLNTLLLLSSGVWLTHGHSVMQRYGASYGRSLASRQFFSYLPSLTLVSTFGYFLSLGWYILRYISLFIRFVFCYLSSLFLCFIAHL